MPRDFKLVDEVLGYVTAEDPTNTDPRYLVGGSQNVLIDFQRKVRTRQGYSRLGAANTALTPIRNGWTWNDSTGDELPQRFYDDELEVYLGSVDGTDIDAWTRVSSGWNTTNTLRPAVWWDATENLDLQLMVIGDANIYEWNGAVAIVDSVPSGTTVKKTGSTTFAQNRFYTTRNKTFTCVRTGTDYTYTAGESSITLTGIGDTTGLQAGDILIQKVVTKSNAPASGRINDTIIVFENQLVLGSFSDNEDFISKNSSYYDFTYSAPRVAGEGGLMTLDSPSSGFGALGGNLLAFAGRSSIYKAKYQEIAVGTTLAETLSVKKLDTGIDQGAMSPDCIIPIGNSLAYLSYEPALRTIDNPDDIGGLKPKTLSNPIKPDFDAEDFTGTKGIWFKNTIFMSSPVNSRSYMLEYTEDADGKLRRYWQPPQILPVGAYSIIDSAIHGHSNVIPETYMLFDGFSDINSEDEKLPINCMAAYSYRNYGKRALLKDFDEWYTEGEGSPSTTDLAVTLNYNYGGYAQVVQKNIDCTDDDILEEVIPNISLGQNSLGTQPLGGGNQVPPESRKFRVQHEIAREDFNEIQVIYSTNEVDRYWAILASGPNVVTSPRRNISIKK